MANRFLNLLNKRIFIFCDVISCEMGDGVILSKRVGGVVYNSSNETR